MLMKFEDARKLIDSKYDIVDDLGDAWLFSWKEAENTVGGDQGYVVMKETGEIMLPYMHFMKDAIIDQKYVKNVSVEYSENAFEEACQFVVDRFPQFEEDLCEEDDSIKYKEYIWDRDDEYEIITVSLEKEPQEGYCVYIKSTVPLE